MVNILSQLLSYRAYFFVVVLDHAQWVEISPEDSGPNRHIYGASCATSLQLPQMRRIGLRIWCWRDAFNGQRSGSISASLAPPAPADPHLPRRHSHNIKRTFPECDNLFFQSALKETNFAVPERPPILRPLRSPKDSVLQYVWLRMTKPRLLVTEADCHLTAESSEFEAITL